MASNESLQLGTFSATSFDIQDAKFACAYKPEDYEEFTGIVQGLRGGSSLSTLEAEALKNRFGYYFRAAAYGRELGGAKTYAHGVAISRDRETKVCHVEGIRTNENEPSARDGMYYVWLRKVIPHFSGGLNFIDPPSHGTECSEIRFGNVTDSPTQELLDSCGLEEDDSWYLPIPQLTVISSQGGIDGWMDGMESHDARKESMALVTQEDKSPETKTTFFENGRELGTLQRDATTETLTDAEGHELPIITPDYADNSDMAESFGQDVIRRQLGFVTLKRALLVEE
jgi:hypothetical protein